MFHTIFYLPLYNALALLSSILPGGDIGLSIIILTIIFRAFLFPLYQKSLVTQLKMKKIEPEIAAIRVKYKDQPQEQTKHLMEIYKHNQINPFASILALLIQLPIILALFYVFRTDFVFVKTELYSFITAPDKINLIFLGFINLAQKNLWLSLLVGVSQFIQLKISLPASAPKKSGAEPSFKDDFARSMNMQMRYVMPVFIAFVAYSLSSAISLYWIVGNIFSIVQELYVRKAVKVKYS